MRGGLRGKSKGLVIHHCHELVVSALSEFVGRFGNGVASAAHSFGRPNSSESLVRNAAPVELGAVAKAPDGGQAVLLEVARGQLRGEVMGRPRSF